MALLSIFGLVVLLDIDTRTVGDIASIQGGFPPFHLPEVPLTLETLHLDISHAAIVAGVGLIESLLTLNIVDEIPKHVVVEIRKLWLRAWPTSFREFSGWAVVP